MKVVKNKLAPPFQLTEFDILYGHGIDANGDLVDMATNAGVLEKRGAYFALDGEALAQGRERMRELLNTDAALRERIALRVGLVKPEPIKKEERSDDAQPEAAA